MNFNESFEADINTLKNIITKDFSTGFSSGFGVNNIQNFLDKIYNKINEYSHDPEKASDYVRHVIEKSNIIDYSTKLAMQYWDVSKRYASDVIQILAKYIKTIDPPTIFKESLDYMKLKMNEKNIPADDIDAINLEDTFKNVSQIAQTAGTLQSIKRYHQMKKKYLTLKKAKLDEIKLL